MKITKKLSALLLVAVLSIGMATAQVGLQAGYTSSKSNFENSKALNGFHVGATFDMGIQGPVNLQYGLLYNLGQYSKSVEALKSKYTYTHHSIDVPVRVAFSLPVGMLKLTAFAGPNFNYGIAYSKSIKVGDLESKKTNMYDNDDNSRFNLQVGGGLAVQYGKIGVKASYDLGVLETVKDVEKSKINSFKVGIIYNF